MKAMKVTENVWWVGAIDWDAYYFHGQTFTTKRGTTYNAYLIIDEKITLVDGVYGKFTDEMFERIKSVIEPSKIDTVIVNHIEPDHSQALPEVAKVCPNAKFYGTAKAGAGLERYYGQKFNFNVLKTGDKLSLGKRALQFIEIPMIHWPDSMMSFLEEDGILFSNDAFGQHYATSERFDDEVSQDILMEEAKKYYAGILWPFNNLIAARLEEIEKLNLPIKIIATSHGISWRRDPAKIINSYKKWAAGETEPKIIIAYETMWGSTAKMARRIADGIQDAGGVKFNVYNMAEADRTEVLADMLDARAFIVGSSNHDSGILPSMVSFIEALKGIRPKGRKGFAFGSYGWSGLALKKLEEELKTAGIETVSLLLSVVYAPDETQLAACYEQGKKIAEIVKGAK